MTIIIVFGIIHIQDDSLFDINLIIIVSFYVPLLFIAIFINDIIN